MADINDLQRYILVIVMVGILCGIGIIVFDNFGSSQRVSTSYVEQITVYNYTTTALTNDDLDSVTSLVNGSQVIPASSYTVDLAAGTVQLIGSGSRWNNTAVNATYNYWSYDQPIFTTMASLTTTVATIPSTWLPLIITILVLAVILLYVMRSFGNTR